MAEPDVQDAQSDDKQDSAEPSSTAQSAQPAPARRRPAWKPGSPLVLMTKNFMLRSVAPEQVGPWYVEWLQDPELMAFLNLEPRQGDSPQQAMERMRRYVGRSNNRTNFHLGVYPKGSQRQIGFFALEMDFRNGTAQTRVVIGDKDYWGKHVVRECRAAIIEFVFRTTNFVKIWGMTSSRNIPSIYNYKAQGFQSEGVLRNHIRTIEGGRFDVILFGLMRDEWEKRKEQDQ
jgi:RimJ/RimL family protein N-acetyltransferase